MTTQRKRMFCTWTDSLEAWKKNQAYQEEKKRKEEEEEANYNRLKDKIQKRAVHM